METQIFLTILPKNSGMFSCVMRYAALKNSDKCVHSPLLADIQHSTVSLNESVIFTDSRLFVFGNRLRKSGL